MPSARQIGSDLLVSVEYVKFRQSGPGKSPIGVISAFQDRIEWKELKATDPSLVVPYSNVKMQKISPPNKDKIQLQILMHNEDQATFVFMRSGANKEGLVADRELIKETIQQALVRYRQLHNSEAQRSAKTQNDLTEAKTSFLKENKELQLLYRYLVASKMISNEDFWSVHKVPVAYKEHLGIPSGFLNSVSQTEEKDGIRLNLTVDTIRAIFKTYPVVEKKHLELVPHAMNEHEFWAKFFQSHYFHRERDMNEDPNDPFFDCDKNDVNEMREEKSNTAYRPTIDFEYIMDDLGIISEIGRNALRSARNDEDEDVDRLVRRCNYHSGRLLSTLTEKSVNEASEPEAHSSHHIAYEFDLESAELAGAGYTKRSTDGQNICLKASSFERGPQEYDEPTAKRFKSAVSTAANEPPITKGYIDGFFEDLLESSAFVETIEQEEEFSKTLKPKTLEDIKSLYPVTRELLRHFWLCMPPTRPEAKEKLERMHQTLAKFATMLTNHSTDKISPKHMKRLFFMISMAQNRYVAYKKLNPN